MAKRCPEDGYELLESPTDWVCPECDYRQVKSETKQQRRVREYIAAYESDPHCPRCPVCRQLGSKSGMDRHHVRRRGDNMLVYIYVHRCCHDAIETCLKWAVTEGFIERDRDREKRFHSVTSDFDHLL